MKNNCDHSAADNLTGYTHYKCQKCGKHIAKGKRARNKLGKDCTLGAFGKKKLP